MNEISGAFHLVTQVDKSFYFSWHSISNKDRTILMSTCVTKCKAPIYDRGNTFLRDWDSRMRAGFIVSGLIIPFQLTNRNCRW